MISNDYLFTVGIRQSTLLLEYSFSKDMEFEYINMGPFMNIGKNNVKLLKCIVKLILLLKLSQYT
jgi:hypothetical protein